MSGYGYVCAIGKLGGHHPVLIISIIIERVLKSDDARSYSVV